jgi:hypothetical protein
MNTHRRFLCMLHPISVEVRPKPKKGSRDLVNIRPISVKWRSDDKLISRKPAYRTAVANVAYIWRDGEPLDQFGKMPASFAMRRFELIASGLALPASAPLWACDGYSVWREADYHADLEGDPTAISAWHVVLSLPHECRNWKSFLEDFIAEKLVQRGAAVAWAIHAIKGEAGGWLVHPHAHLVVSSRGWRRNAGWGLRQENGLNNHAAHQRFKRAWIARLDRERAFSRMPVTQQSPLS